MMRSLLSRKLPLPLSPSLDQETQGYNPCVSIKLSDQGELGFRGTMWDFIPLGQEAPPLSCCSRVPQKVLDHQRLWVSTQGALVWPHARPSRPAGGFPSCWWCEECPALPESICRFHRLSTVQQCPVTPSLYLSVSTSLHTTPRSCAQGQLWKGWEHVPEGFGFVILPQTARSGGGGDVFRGS